jgi:hypothetical protein
MAQTLKFGNKTWATKVGSTLAYNDENGNYKPLPFAFTRSTSATRVNKEGLIEVVTNDRPRIDYTDTSDGVLLLEKAATNLITYSEDFSNAAWVKFSQGIGSTPIVTPNYAISPDGTLNASRLQCDLNGGNSTSVRSWLYQTITTISGDNAFSLYVKNNSNKEITFTLSNAVAETVVVLSDDKWHRLSTIRSGGGQPRIGLVGGVGASDSADLLIYGAQVETGNVASSYIPTQGSASTRVAETASGAGNSEVFNDSEGVLFFDIAANNNDATYKLISITNDQQNDNFISLGYSNDNTNAYKQVKIGGVDVFDATQRGGSVINQNLYSKIALKYKSGNSSFYINGFEVDSSSLTYTPSNVMSGLKFYYFNNTLPFYGKTKEIGYYNTILTDLELETLTSYKSWTSMVNELNLNIIYNG